VLSTLHRLPKRWGLGQKRRVRPGRHYDRALSTDAVGNPSLEARAAEVVKPRPLPMRLANDLRVGAAIASGSEVEPETDRA